MNQLNRVTRTVISVDSAAIRVTENLLGALFSQEGFEKKYLVSATPKRNQKACVEVSISDTGCGIPKGDLKKIFDKFKRADAGRETAGGTGLGLSIAKHIIAAHGGEIWAESEPGKGSTFFFTLPVV